MKKWLKVVLAVMLVGILGTGCNDEQKDQLQEVSKYLKDANNPVVQIQTSQGDMFIELYENDAPGSVGNFLAYVNDGFYRVFSVFINPNGA